MREMFEEENVIGLVASQIQKFIGLRDRDFQAKDIFRTYCMFIAAYFCIDPFKGIDSMLEYASMIFEAFCSPSGFFESIDHLTVEMIFVMSLVSEGDELLPFICPYIDAFIDKLVCLVVSGNSQIAIYSCKTITNLAFSNEWLIGQFANRGLLFNSLSVLRKRNSVLSNEILVLLNNVLNGESNLSSELVSDANLVMEVVSALDWQAACEDNAMNFLTDYLFKEHNPLVRDFVLSHTEIAKVLVRKIDLTKSRYFLVKLCHALRSLLRIGEDESEKKPTIGNTFKELILNDCDLFERLALIEDHADRAVAGLFRQLKSEYFP
jgi:hypothetical protein